MAGFFRWLTGGKSPREYITRLKITVRRLERQRKKIESQESSLKKRIADALKRGDMNSARMYAKDLVRNRNMALGYYRLTSRINGLIYKLERAHALQSFVGEIKGVARALRDINATLRIPDIDELVNDMERSIEGIDVSSEVMEEGLEGLTVEETDDAEVDKILGELGAEVGVSASTSLPTPSGVSTAELEEEIEKLKKEE